MKQKHLLVIKLLITLILLTGILYITFNISGAILGICGTIITLGMMDKNFKGKMVKEYFIILGVQVFTIILTMIANINYLTLGISTLILSLVINKIFIYYKKSSRTMGFFYLFMFIVYMSIKLPNINYSSLLIGSVVSSLLILLAYFILTRKFYFNGKEAPKAEIDIEDFNAFKNFKFRFNILSSIAYTIAIVSMKYFYAYHGLWLAITLFVVLLPDKGLSLKKVIHRVIGTVSGAIIYIAATYIFSGSFSFIITLATIASVYFMFYPMKYYAYQSICVTFFALSIDSLFYKTQTHLFLSEYRIIFTVLGCIIILVLFEIEKLVAHLMNKFKSKNLERSDKDRCIS